MGTLAGADTVWDVALVCLLRDRKESREMDLVNWGLADRWLPTEKGWGWGWRSLPDRRE